MRKRILRATGCSDQQLQLQECSQEPKEMEASNTNTNTAQQFRFDKVKELNSKGYATKTIARTLHMERATIRKYIRMEALLVREGKRSTHFASFQAFLLQEGNRKKTYMELYEIIKEDGFGGRSSQFCSNMNSLLKEHKIIPAADKESSEKCGKEENEFMEMLYDKIPLAKTTAELVARFKQLFQNKEEGSLKAWIENAQKPTSGIKSFAKGLLSDFTVADNPVITPYSNGQLEGQVNRLKNIKRRMFGRAKFDLRKMVIFKSG
jgi:hypothetical protein